MEISNILINMLANVADILNKLKVKYCVIGGLAVSMLTRPRATEDVDFLIFTDNSERDNLLKELSKKIDIIQNKEPFVFKNATIWRLVVKEKNLENSDFVILDFLLAEKSEHKKALNSTLNININNTTVRVIDIENLINIKKLAGRRIDQIDIEELNKALKQ